MSAALVIRSSAEVEAALAVAGCSVVAADSFDSALALLARDRRWAPELIVVDVEHPDLVAWRRLQSRLRDVPAIALCDSTFEIPTLLGVTDFVTRPLRAGELTARIRSALRSRTERARVARREHRLTQELQRVQHEMHDLERKSCVDPLTGVANRRHAISLLDAEWRRSAREHTSLALVMIDLDHFHSFNEHYGHLGGDACLKRVTAAMASCLRRPSYFLGRYGGEEFIVVMPSTEASGARIVGERLRGIVEGLKIPHTTGPNSTRVVTISVGFAACEPRAGLATDALVAMADAALLAAKRGGRNRVRGDAPRAITQPNLASEEWSRFPIVIAEPWYADRIPRFLADKRAELPTFEAACRTGDLDRVRLMSRKLQVSAVAHGFDHIARLASQLETAARGGNRDVVQRELAELALYVDHVQVAYRRTDQTG